MKVLECGCIMPGEDDQRKWGVLSCIHDHPSAKGAEKRYTAKVTFFDRGGNRVKLCPKCRKDVINGMSHGGNYK